MIPRDRNLEGLQLFAQTVVVDPLGAYGRTFAFSDGLRVVLAAD